MNEYEVFTTLFSGLFFWYLLVRLLRPYKCICGRRIWTGKGILKHLAQPHKWNP